MVDASTNSPHGCDKVPTVPTCTNLSTAESLKHATYFKEHASRHAVLPTLSKQTSKISDPQILMRCQLWKPRIFTPPGTAAEPRTRTEQEREARTRSTSKETQRNAQQPQHARASHTEDHAAQNPRIRDRAAGKKDMPEPLRDEHNPRVATAGEEQPDCDPIQACPIYGEASEHIGILTSSNAHPDCAKATVHKPHGVTVLDGEPACATQRERMQEIGKLQKARATDQVRKRSEEATVRHKGG